MQKELDVIIQQSIYQMTKNLKPIESGNYNFIIFNIFNISTCIK
jgi:hypothetical protein